MTLAEAKFWRKRDEYHNLAKKYEKNIKITHPKTVKCDVLHDVNCTYCATNTIYYNEPNLPK